MLRSFPISKKTLPLILSVLSGCQHKNPWSLPFAHKQLFADRADQYDLFIYTEDDILITERNIRAFLDVTDVLLEDEIAGFLRIEKDINGNLNYPEVHGHFHWDCTSVRVRGNYHLAHFTNEHAACYLLTQHQLQKAISSGGFLIEPHEGKYDLLCSAATDPYTQCGFKKFIPVSHIDDFSAHHLPNKYIGKLGVARPELDAQIASLLQISCDAHRPVPLLNTETRLWHRMYSKDYYEPVREEILSVVPQDASKILSIGSGSAANERRLVEDGRRVVAVPLDPVIGSSLSQLGVEVASGDPLSANADFKAERFDCLLYLNVLQFARKPEKFLSLFVDLLLPHGTVIISVPNLPWWRYVWHGAKNDMTLRKWGNYETAGIHNTSIGKIQNWCANSGLTVEKIMRFGLDRHKKMHWNFLSYLLAPDVVVVARKN